MIGEMLKQERNKINLSQKALAEKSGVSFVTINKIEQGKPVKLSILDKVFSVFGKRIVYRLEDPFAEQQKTEEVVVF